MKFFALLLTVFLGDLYFAQSRLVLRRKRDGDFLGQLGQAITKLTGPLLGNKETAQNNDPIVSQPSLSSLSSSGTSNQAAPQSPSVVQSVGFCSDNQVQCDYLACLAHNFKNSDQASNLRQGTKAMADPELRDAIANDPQVSKIACQKANLDDTGCNGFKQLMGLVSKLDPKSAHVHDEPRDKRSSDYYETLPKAKVSASVSSSSSSSSNSGSKTGQTSSSTSNKGGTSGSSSSMDYDRFGNSKSKSKPDSNAQKDCQAILRKPSKGKSVSKAKRAVRGG